jgi:hypothetical protein
MAITLENVVNGILQNTNKNYKILSSSPKKVRFKINCESVQLFGTVTDSNYTMEIKKSDGYVLDKVDCAISHTDDIFNRINESITTGTKLSKYVSAVSDAKKDFLTPGFVKEDEETSKHKELLLDDEEDEDTQELENTSNKDMKVFLNDLIDNLDLMASQTKEFIDYIDGTEDDIDNKSSLVSILGGFYSLEDDIMDLIEDMYPPEEDIETESIKSTSKTRNIKKETINILSKASVLLSGNKKFAEEKEAIKVIKSSLTLK